MSVTIDANVLVYASNTSDPVHDQARALIERIAGGPEVTYLFWPTTLGYLRIATHPGILPRPLSPAEAMHNVGALLTRPHIRAPAEADGFWTLYQETTRGLARGNEVPDAHLVTLMRQHGVRVILTRDRDLRRYEGIEVRDPFT